MNLLKRGCIVAVFVASYFEFTRHNGSGILGVIFVLGGLFGIGILLRERAEKQKLDEK